MLYMFITPRTSKFHCFCVSPCRKVTQMYYPHGWGPWKNMNGYIIRYVMKTYLQNLHDLDVIRIMALPPMLTHALGLGKYLMHKNQVKELCVSMFWIQSGFVERMYWYKPKLGNFGHLEPTKKTNCRCSIHSAHSIKNKFNTFSVFHVPDLSWSLKFDNWLSVTPNFLKLMHKIWYLVSSKIFEEPCLSSCTVKQQPGAQEWCYAAHFTMELSMHYGLLSRIKTISNFIIWGFLP